MDSKNENDETVPLADTSSNGKEKNIDSENADNTSPTTKLITSDSPPNEGVARNPLNGTASKVSPADSDAGLEGFNMYRNGKTATQGLMDLSVLFVNVTQLRFAITKANGPHTVAVFAYIIIVLLIISMVLQIIVGILLVLSATYDINSTKDREKAFEIGNRVAYGSFIITVLNIFIATFGNYDNSVIMQLAQNITIPSGMSVNATSGS